jgi:hypothetical protein
MKNRSALFFSGMLVPLLLVFVFNSCKSKTATTYVNTDTRPEKKKGNPHTGFLGAMEYEHNMLKDPVTGKIPEGIRELELAQAREILAQQATQQARVMANTYTFQGPDNLGGRTRSIVYDVRYNGTSNRTLLAGGVSGGVYKSTDDGATWVRKSPTGQHFSCTGIAQDPRAGFQDTWYYAVGEAIGNSASGTGANYSGNGVYKSTDNGETWARLGNSNPTSLEAFNDVRDFIQKIIVNPANGDVYIACIATIYRSQDGGASWGAVLSGAAVNTSNMTDIVVNSAGNRFYAGFAGSITGGTDGVWTSTTGNSGTWTRIAGGGAPAAWNAQGTYGRVVLAIAPSNENILYALYWNNVTNLTCAAPVPEAEFFHWNQTTTTWSDRSASLPDDAAMCLPGNDPFSVQGGYDLVVAVKPDDENTVFLGGTNLYRSTNGFTSTATTTRIGGYNSAANFALYPNSHPDIHAIVFQPGTPATMLCGNDGGIQRTTNNLAGSVTWSQINVGYRTYQYYHVAIDPRTGNSKVLGGAQDNGTTRNIGGTGINFEGVIGGDGVSVGLSNVILGATYEYGGSQTGFIYRRNSASGLGAFTNITPTYVPAAGGGLFVTVHKLDADNTEFLYHAFDNRLARHTSASTATSASWVEFTGVATAVGAANDITFIATTRGTYNPATASVFFGTTNSRLYRLDDPVNTAAGTAPVDISGAGITALPAAGFISSIAVNPRNDDTVIVTYSNYGMASNIFWTGNANAAVPTWTAVDDNLTLPSIRSSAIAITQLGVEYFVGTSIGLYNSPGIDPAIPANTNWVQDGASEIGNAVVSSLALRPADNHLLAGTHGYGMWRTVLSMIGLPVTLSKFTGTLQGKKSLLEWETSSEVNSRHFVLEKSFDGISFRKIATIPAAGNSNGTLRYSYTDSEPLTENNFYRLRSVDLDNKEKLSNIVLVKLPNAGQGIVVLGNPFKDNILLRFVKAPRGKVEMRLIDMGGRVVARQSLTQPNQQLTFGAVPANLSNGVYQLQVVVDGAIFNQQVVKQ